MSPSKYDRQRPKTARSEDETSATENGDRADGVQQGPTFETLVDDQIEGSVEEVREEIELLREQVEAVDNFARISLNERKVKQNEVKLSEFSDSLTGFAEKAFSKLNTLEKRLDTHALVLAALVDAHDGEVDLSAAQNHQSERLVMHDTPNERLTTALDSAQGAKVADDD